MADIDYSNILNLRNAVIVGEKRPGLTTDSEVTLLWPKIAQGTTEGAADWARANRVTMTAFEVGQNTFDGLWRSVEIETEPNKDRGFSLSHTFRFGYATSLSEDEARFGKIEAGVQNETLRLTRVWNNLDNKAVDAIVVATALSKTVTNPKIEGTEKTGVFTVVDVSGETADDGSGTVSQTFLTPYDTGVVLSYMENCDIQVDITFYHDYTKAEVEALDTSYALSATGVTVRIQVLAVDPATGLYDVIVTTRTRQYRPYDVRYSVYSNDAYTQTDERLGVYADTYIPSIYGAKQGQLYRQQVQIKDDCTKDVTTDFTTSRTDAIYFGSRRTQFSHTDEAVYANWRTLIAAPTPDSGVYDATNQLKPDGTYNSRLVYTVGVNSGEACFVTSRSGTGTADEILYKSRTSQIGAPPSDQGGVYSARNSLGEDGLYDASLVYKRSVEASVSAVSRRTPFKLTNGAIYDNSRDPLVAPTTTAGVYSASQRINEDLTYSGSLTYEVGVNSGEAYFATSRSGTGTADEILYKSRTSQIGAPPSDQGGVYAANNNLGNDGLYDATLVYKRSVEASVYAVSRRTPFKLTDGALYDNSRSPLIAPDATAGVYSASQRINEDLTYSGSLTYEVGTNSGEACFAAGVAALENRDSILYKSRTTPVNAPPSNSGGIYTSNNNLGDDGLYDATLVYQASVPAQVNFTSSRTPFRLENSLVYENSKTAIVPKALVAGDVGVYRASNRFNPDGTFNGSLTYACGTNSGEAKFLVTDRADSQSSEILYKSRTSPVGAIADGTGYVYEARNSLGDDGLYDASLVYNASKPVQVAARTENNWLTDEHILLYKNAVTIPSIPPVECAGTYKMLGVRQNADSTYDAALIYNSSKKREFMTAFTDQRSTVYLYRYENKRELDFPAVSPYSHNTVSGISLNPDQTYTFSVRSKSLVGTGGVQIWDDSDAQVYLKRAGSDGKHYYFSKLFTTNKTEAEKFISGNGKSDYGEEIEGSTIVGYYDSHVTNYSWQGSNRFISTRVDLME